MSTIKEKRSAKRKEGRQFAARQREVEAEKKVLARVVDVLLERLNALDGDPDMEPDQPDEDGGGEDLYGSRHDGPGDEADAELNGDEHEPNGDEQDGDSMQGAL